MVISIWIFHFGEGTKYVWGSFRNIVGIFFFLLIFWPCIYLILFGLSLNLFEHHVMAHMTRFRSLWAHYAIFCSLLTYNCFGGHL